MEQYARQRSNILYVMLTVICFIWIVLSANTASAATREDGTYTVEYLVLQSTNDSVSIANDYFQKPANFIQVGDRQWIELTVNHSAWVQSLKAQFDESYNDVEIIDEDQEQDTRTIRFPIQADLSQPVHMQMHIKIETMEPVYDHRYTVRFAFDSTSLEWSGPAPEMLVNEQPVQDTSKGTMWLIYAFISILIIITITLFLKNMRKSKQNS